MSNILIKDAQLIATFSNEKILKNQSIYIEENIIKDIGSSDELEKKYNNIEKIIDAKNKIVLPGFINNHHHLFQSLFRHVPLLQNQPIQKWIATMCALSENHTEESAYYATMINMAELMLSGCTTSSDLMYIFTKNKNDLFKSNIEAAQNIGMRFFPYRGSILQQKNNLFPETISQTEEEIIDHTKEMIEKYNKNNDLMLKIGAGPVSIFTSNTELIKKYAQLKESYNVLLQTPL